MRAIVSLITGEITVVKPFTEAEHEAFINKVVRVLSPIVFKPMQDLTQPSQEN